MILKSLALLVFVYLLILSLFFFTQRSHIYFPSQLKQSKAAMGVPNMQDVVLTTDDGLQLDAWYQAAQVGKPTLVYFHGNGGNFTHRGPLVLPYLQQGYGVLLAEYRGYAGNPGQPSEQGFYLDARAAMRFLQQQGIPASDTILYGESIGSAVAVQMGLEHDIKALVLQSPFTSLADIGSYHYPIFPVRLLIKDKYASIDKIGNITAAVIIVHGKNDRIVPVSFGQRLYDAANQPKFLYVIDNNGHNDLSPAVISKDVINKLDSL